MKRLELASGLVKPRAHTKKQAQDMLQIGLSTVDALIAEGRLKTFKIGKSVRITADSIDRLINE